MSFHVPEKNRVTNGTFRTSEKDGNNGAFILMTKNGRLHCIVSDGMGWEHVSISRPDRCPTWEEMCLVKSVFWDDEDCVMQLHPPKSEWVNNHPYCLHLWKPSNENTADIIPRPNAWMVGVQ